MAFSTDGAAAVRGLRQHQRRLGRSTSPRARPVERIVSRSRRRRRRARRRTRSRSRPTARTLLVANADNNSVAVVDVARRARAASRASSPPAGIRPASPSTPRARTCSLLSGKGLTAVPNPRGPQPTDAREGSTYIAGILSGALSILTRPDARALARMTERVFAISAYNEGDASAAGRRRLADSGRVGEPSPIRHVIYIIRENRTYDQVLGDLPRGNGDPSLCLFGERRHAQRATRSRASSCCSTTSTSNAEVSADGHNWSHGRPTRPTTSRRLWPTHLRRARTATTRAAVPRTDARRRRRPRRGYLWDLRARGRRHATATTASSSSMRRPAGNARAGHRAGPRGHGHRTYPRLRHGHPRPASAPTSGSSEFRRFERDGGLPRARRSSACRTTTPRARAAASPRRGRWSPTTTSRSGRMVEALSRSRFWRRRPIFVLEDDAQNGPDHVDAHRTRALVVSP